MVFSNNFYILSCDFNKYTMRVIRKLSQAKIKSQEEKIANDDDEEMMLIKNEDNSESDEKMSDDETSEE